MASCLKQWIRWMVLMGVVLLTGCIQYNLDVQFDSQTHGQVVQHLRWRGGGASLSTVESWLQVLSDRTQAVGGKLQVIGDSELEITVPFHNGKDLETRFNQFFHPTDDAPPLTLPGGDPIQAELSVQQGNWLLAIYTHLSLRIDLTAVPDLTDTPLPLLQGANVLDGIVTVTTPWGVRSPSPVPSPLGTWPLTDGVVNEIEADFWVPSPIGIGAVAIALLMAVSYFLKYGFFQGTPRRG